MDRKKYFGTIIFIYLFFTSILFFSGYFKIGFLSDDYNNLYDAVSTTLFQKFTGILHVSNIFHLRPINFLILQLFYYIHNLLNLNFDDFISYRIGNLFLFFLFSFLCGIMIFHLTKNYYLSLLGLLTIIIFPSNIHNICWTSGRVDLLCGIFFAGYLYLTICNLEKKSNFFTICSSLSLALALLTKETAITAFPVCLIFVYFFKEKDIIKSNYNIFIIHFIILLLYFIYKFLIHQIFLNIQPSKFSYVFVKAFISLFLPMDYLSILYQLKHDNITILIYFVIFITFLFLYFLYLFQLKIFKISFFAALLFFISIIPYAIGGYVRPQIIIIPFSFFSIFLISSSVIKKADKRTNFKKSLIISYCIVLISWSYFTILNIQQWVYGYNYSKSALNNLLYTNINLQKPTYILCSTGRLDQIFMLDDINGAYNYWKYQQPIIKDTLNELVLTGCLDKDSINSKFEINNAGINEFEVISKNDDHFFYIEDYDINKEHYIFDNDLFHIEFSKFNYLNKPTDFKIKFKNNNINCYVENELQFYKIF